MDIRRSEVDGIPDIRAGRQYEIDAIDMVLYDWRAVDTARYVGVEALAALRNTSFGPTINPHSVDGTPGGPLLDGRYGEVSRDSLWVEASLHNLQYTHLDLSYRRIQTLGSEQPDEVGKAGINQE